MHPDDPARNAALLGDLVALPGPPGQEDAVREYLAGQVAALGLPWRTDAKGNLLVSAAAASAATEAPWPDRPDVVVTAHLDEIALMVIGLDEGPEHGMLRVAPLGGAHPWKWGEGPVEVLARGRAILPGVLSFGSVHTTAPESMAQQVRDGAPPAWQGARIVTGLSAAALRAAGVRPGTRVVVARARRTVWEMAEGALIASYFLDDRADLVAWLNALAAVRDRPEGAGVVFAATVSEEVGGEGASFLLQRLRPAVCVALEIGPRTPDAPFPLDAHPTIWVSDSYAASDPRDLDLLDEAARDLGLSPHWQALTRGGSDASCAASRGLCARPVTIGFPTENSHGFEIMHRDAPANLARLLVAYLQRLRAAGVSGEGNAPPAAQP